jgi:hypothetical protein
MELGTFIATAPNAVPVLRSMAKLWADQVLARPCSCHPIAVLLGVCFPTNVATTTQIAIPIAAMAGIAIPGY